MSQGPPAYDDLASRRGQMFPDLTAAEIDRIRPFGEEVTFDAGTIIIEQGAVGTPFYVVLEGEIEIVHPHNHAEELIVVHHAGQFTGEIELVTDRRALVRARARTKLRALKVLRKDFRVLVAGDSRLSELLLRAFILRRMGLFRAGQGDVIVIGSRHSAATLRLQAFLVRNTHPTRYVDVDKDPDVQSFLDGFGVKASEIPILICGEDRVLKNPTDAEVADCLGFNAALALQVVRDVIVCGAGPGGLAAAVYAASEGLDVLVIESDAPGGQAASSSKIENYLGFPTGISGQALTARALSQAEKFGAQIAVAHGAVHLHCEETPFRLELAGGTSVRAKAIVIATGAEYRKLAVENLSRFEGVGVYYAATYVEAQRCDDEELVIVGGGNSAGQAATFLAQKSKHVHILIRRGELADTMSRYLINRIEEAHNITLHRHTEIVALDGDDHLERVTWRCATTNETTTHPIRHVFTMAGAVPNTNWLHACVATDAKGFVRTGNDLSPEELKTRRWPLKRLPHLFETSLPRVFAVGDVRATSVKRVASAVGEGSVCIQLVHQVLAE